MSDRIKHISLKEKYDLPISIEFSEHDFAKDLSQNLNFIQNLNQIITDSAEKNSFMQCYHFKLTTKDFDDIGKSLINCKNHDETN